MSQREAESKEAWHAANDRDQWRSFAFIALVTLAKIQRTSTDQKQLAALLGLHWNANLFRRPIQRYFATTPSQLEGALMRALTEPQVRDLLHTRPWLQQQLRAFCLNDLKQHEATLRRKWPGVFFDYPDL